MDNIDIKKTKTVNIHTSVAFILLMTTIPLAFFSIGLESDTLYLLSLLSLIVTIVLSIISFKKVKKGIEVGRDLAITTIAISIIVAFFLIAIDIQTVTDENTRIDAENEASRIAEINKLKKQIEELGNRKPQITTKTIIKESNLNKSNLTSIISEWTPRVGFIACRWDASDTVASGSFVINKTREFESVAATNRHVLSDEFGYAPNKCILVVNNKEYSISWAENIFYFGDDEDFGFIKTDIPSKVISVCGGNKPSNPKIGDEVVILGYPGIGSQESITATEGIISGIESNYYVTSAKIEEGNSGGAAILIKDNCYLGIPSYAKVGSVETLGRILKARFVFTP